MNSRKITVRYINQVKIFKPKYAIPFASNHCYGRPDTTKFNDYATKMSFMEDYWERNKGKLFGRYNTNLYGKRKLSLLVQVFI